MTASKILPRFRKMIDGSAEDLNACIEWPWSKTPRGYGQFGYEGKVRKAHRVSYVISWGLTLDDIEGVEIRHSCDCPPCVNPMHLLPGTHQENMNDMVERGRVKSSGGSQFQRAKTNCPAGHPYDFGNTSLGKDGTRRCRTCHRNRTRSSRLATKEYVRELMAAKLARPKEA